MRNIIAVCADPGLLKTHALVLEKTGHRVLGVLNYAELRDALQQQTCDLVVVGSSIAPSEKRRIFYMVRQYSSRCPILEMYQISPELPDSAASVRDEDGPTALIEAVNEQFAVSAPPPDQMSSAT
ncbi:MAG: hypothetical protein JOZ43_06180 [Acidobacteriales bacterium]|nr:hypothetical protein [Terriglobales bacterium]